MLEHQGDARIKTRILSSGETAGACADQLEHEGDHGAMGIQGKVVNPVNNIPIRFRSYYRFRISIRIFDKLKKFIPGSTCSKIKGLVACCHSFYYYLFLH